MQDLIFTMSSSPSTYEQFLHSLNCTSHGNTETAVTIDFINCFGLLFNKNGSQHKIYGLQNGLDFFQAKALSCYLLDKTSGPLYKEDLDLCMHLYTYKKARQCLLIKRKGSCPVFSSYYQYSVATEFRLYFQNILAVPQIFLQFLLLGKIVFNFKKLWY